ncbi:hypothetical protein CC79DRAFT_114311 [Sarocladium strictum]
MNNSTGDIEPPQLLPGKEAPASEYAYTTLYVHVYPSPLFAAHWSFFLPREDLKSEIGDRIHVTGDGLNGFEYEYVRDYDPKEDARRPNAFPIGRVMMTAMQRLIGGQVVDEADDRSMFDRICRQVPAPGPSLNSASASTGNGAPKRREVRDCQWWIKQATIHLVNEGILLPLDQSDAHPAESPLTRVDALPKH